MMLETIQLSHWSSIVSESKMVTMVQALSESRRKRSQSWSVQKILQSNLSTVLNRQSQTNRLPRMKRDMLKMRQSSTLKQMANLQRYHHRSTWSRRRLIWCLEWNLTTSCKVWTHRIWTLQQSLMKMKRIENLWLVYKSTQSKSSQEVLQTKHLVATLLDKVLLMLCSVITFMPPKSLSKLIFSSQNQTKHKTSWRTKRRKMTRGLSFSIETLMATRLTTWPQRKMPGIPPLPKKRT